MTSREDVEDVARIEVGPIFVLQGVPFRHIVHYVVLSTFAQSKWYLLSGRFFENLQHLFRIKLDILIVDGQFLESNTRDLRPKIVPLLILASQSKIFRSSALIKTTQTRGGSLATSITTIHIQIRTEKTHSF